MWATLIFAWSVDPDPWYDFDGESFLGEAPPTLLLVMTIMILACALFEFFYARETQCVMPCTSGGEPWDPIVHGVPAKYRWFGLPAMWFTTQEAHDDLKLWLTHARRHHGKSPVHKIYPEEMALFALNANGGCVLRNALLHAKCYSVDKGQFLSSYGSKGQLRPLKDGMEPTQLDVDLVFYDHQSTEYLQPEETYEQGQVHMLPRAPTKRLRSLASMGSLSDEDCFSGHEDVRAHCD
jgi:hypothetical protein